MPSPEIAATEPRSAGQNRSQRWHLRTLASLALAGTLLLTACGSNAQGFADKTLNRPPATANALSAPVAEPIATSAPPTPAPEIKVCTEGYSKSEAVGQTQRQDLQETAISTIRPALLEKTSCIDSSTEEISNLTGVYQVIIKDRLAITKTDTGDRIWVTLVRINNKLTDKHVTLDPKSRISPALAGQRLREYGFAKMNIPEGTPCRSEGSELYNSSQITCRSDDTNLIFYLGDTGVIVAQNLR